MYLDLNAMGAKIRKIRKERGWSQEYLAEKSHFSKQYISKIECGNARPSIDALVNIADALKTSPDELLCYKEDKSRKYIYDEIVDSLKNANDSQLKVIADTLPTIIESWNRISKTC